MKPSQVDDQIVELRRQLERLEEVQVRVATSLDARIRALEQRDEVDPDD